MTLFDEIKAKGFEFDHYESDLYVKDSPEAREIITKHGMGFEVFISQIDELPWLDVPFAYDPYWDKWSKL